MSDLYFTLNGDFLINGNKDLSLTPSSMQEDIQQIYLRLMTEPGDFYIYPQLGIDLSRLYGLPQTKETAEFGKNLIRAGLQREGLFKGRNIKITAVPTSKDTIKFDIHIVSDIDEPIILSVSQNLGD
jgi:hypothetical protein